MSSSRLYLGLISGTSADGIDVALVRFADDSPAASGALVAAAVRHWPADLRNRLITLGQGDDLDLDTVAELHVQTGHLFADASLALLRQAGITAAAVHGLGSHGQTIRHRPGARWPFSWQLGDGNVIAERTGITTVTDLRGRDIAAGGQGAPLLPALHQALLHTADEDRAVLNLGGIANLTLLPAAGAVRGFDTGPANALLDAWCQRHTGAAYDAAGAFAAGGRVDAGLLHRLLDDPWFAQPPPKSTGREQFHLHWLQSRLQAAAPSSSPADIQATLLELSAASVAQALLATQPDTTRVLVCGGGVHNRLLLQRLGAHLPGMRVESTAAHGLDPDYVEAMGMAWIARRTLLGQPGNLATVTGAHGPRLLGAIHPA